MDLNDILIHLLNGLFWGSLIALIALGLSLVYGLLGVLNLAHGEFYMLGAVGAFYIINFLGSFWLATLITPIIIVGIGLLTERYLLRPVENDPSSTLIVTFAISMCLQYGVLYFFGGAPQRINDPVGVIFNLLGIGYPLYRILVIIVTIIIFSSFILFINYSRFGLWIRGAGQDIQLAKALGIPTSLIYLMTFGLGSGFAALAGIMASPIVAVEFKMGLDIIVLAFMASIIGGFGNLKGTFIASILIGIFENFLLMFFEPSYARVILLILSCTLLFFLPEGMFVIPKSSKRI
jgi:branched-chain amino acid transport system permease protein